VSAFGSPCQDVINAVEGRRSIRRFLPTPVDDDVIRRILTAAARAASGMNMQPWLVHVVVGEARDRLSKAVLAATEAGETSLEYPYVPEILKEPYLGRRRKVGYDLYAKYGIDRSDHAARAAAMARNFSFFGAPVGLFFTMDRAMAQGSWLDCGMFMQGVMVVARAFGLETCPQQAWCDFGAIVHRELAISLDHILLAGMALGVVDRDASENTLVTDRVLVDEFATWHR
jgi:nitroreductase